MTGNTAPSVYIEVEEFEDVSVLYCVKAMERNGEKLITIRREYFGTAEAIRKIFNPLVSVTLDQQGRPKNWSFHGAGQVLTDMALSPFKIKAAASTSMGICGAY